MADTGIYATTTQIQYKAGAKASATSKAEAYTNDFVAQAEARINVVSGKIWASDTTEFNALDSGIKRILTECASDLAAIYVINYDLSGFTTRYEAEDMINVLYKMANDCLEILKVVAKSDFMNSPA